MDRGIVGMGNRVDVPLQRRLKQCLDKPAGDPSATVVRRDYDPTEFEWEITCAPRTLRLPEDSGSIRVREILETCYPDELPVLIVKRQAVRGSIKRCG